MTPQTLDRLRRNLPTDAQIEGLLQDFAELCDTARINLNVTDGNASDWYAMHSRLDALYNELNALHTSDVHGTSAAIGL